MTGFRRSFDGEIIEPGDTDYDSARLVFNAMIDRRPALVVRPVGAADVATAVRFATAEGLEIAVRGGAHSPAGHSTVDDGIVVDMGRMRGVRVEPERQLGWVQGGARLRDMDRETTRHGLATTGGYVSHTGVAGLTLGGGYGILGRRHGLASDNLTAVELVTADGAIRRVTEESDPELFWGLRGGGGNFGIATGLEFQLHPIPTRIWSIEMAFHARDAVAVLEAFGELSAAGDRSVTTWASLNIADAGQGLPDERIGKPVLWVGAHVVDGRERLAAALSALRSVAQPLVDTRTRPTYRDSQRAGDGVPGARRRRYWRAHYVGDLTPPSITAFLGPGFDPDAGMDCHVEVVQQGGAIGDRPRDATAFSHRDAAFDYLAVAYWDDPAEDDVRIAAARSAADRMRPFSLGVYVNNLVDEGEGSLRAAYTDGRLKRLIALKRRIDPDNIFHRNANIAPG
ncbi:MAG TPA: FAD-binding oxidoreductase [Candidatus Limnocylindrales bacterium]